MAKILRCIDEHNSMRFFFAFTDDIVKDFEKLQKSSISANIEMGKVLTMNALLYSDLKNDTDSIDLKLKTNGECGLIISKLYNNSFITGYLENKNLSKYDKNYEKGKEISGIDSVDKDIYVYHNNTKVNGNKILTDGGRVLSITALGNSYDEIREKVYRNIEKISFETKQYRKDIGKM